MQTRDNTKPWHDFLRFSTLIWKLEKNTKPWNIYIKMKTYHKDDMILGHEFYRKNHIQMEKNINWKKYQTKKMQTGKKYQTMIRFSEILISNTKTGKKIPNQQNPNTIQTCHDFPRFWYRKQEIHIHTNENTSQSPFKDKWNIKYILTKPEKWKLGIVEQMKHENKNTSQSTYKHNRNMKYI